jgi:multiple sugar transport system ATP-binding protein
MSNFGAGATASIESAAGGALAQVELRGLAKVYPGGVEAVAGVDLAVGDGEYLAIVGPSGSGKSTLLRLVAGLEMPDAGGVWVGGRRVDDRPPGARDAAMVFQDQVPYPHLDVFENIAFGLRARRRPGAEVRDRVEEAAAMAGLSALLRRMPRALSGGQRRRVALARALARRPAILLLDEPLSGLDAPLRASMRADLAEWHRRLGLTTLHVTHDQAEALALGDRVAVMERGRLAQVGAPGDVYDRPASRFVATFIGSPPMSVLPCLVEGTTGALQLRLGASGDEPAPTVPLAASWAAALERRGPGPIELGIRPEHVAVPEDGTAVVATAALVVRGTVHRREPLGHEIRASLEVGPHALALRLPPETAAPIGDVLTARIDLARACWFDPRTGERLA